MKTKRKSKSKSQPTPQLVNSRPGRRVKTLTYQQITRIKNLKGLEMSISEITKRVNASRTVVVKTIEDLKKHEPREIYVQRQNNVIL